MDNLEEVMKKEIGVLNLNAGSGRRGEDLHEEGRDYGENTARKYLDELKKSLKHPGICC